MNGLLSGLKLSVPKGQQLDVDAIIDLGSDRAYVAIEEAAGDPRLLLEPHRTFYGVYHAQGIIDNGGLCYFFENDFTHHPPYSYFADAYRQIGCARAATAIETAAASFGVRHPERDVDKRRRYIEGNYDEEQHTVPGWDESVCGDESIFPALARWYEAFADQPGTDNLGVAPE